MLRNQRVEQTNLIIDMLKILCLVVLKKSMFRKLYEYYDYMNQKVVIKSAFLMLMYGLLTVIEIIPKLLQESSFNLLWNTKNY